MEDTDFYRIYRKSEEDELYFDEPFTKWQAWTDLIALALSRDTYLSFRNVSIPGKRGCVYKSQQELATRWKWSKGKVIRFIRYLQCVGKVTVVKLKVINCIAITKYDIYQPEENPTQTIKPHTTPKPAATPKPATPKNNSRFIEEMKREVVWQEAMCMNFHISVSELLKRLDEFKLNLSCRDTSHDSLQDAKRHFNDWLRIKQSVEAKQKNAQRARLPDGMVLRTEQMKYDKNTDW